MPYISAAELERSRWMTLAEAIDWVCRRDNCGRRAATREIRKALADNALVLRWGDQSTNPSSGRTKLQPVVPVAPAAARPPIVSAAEDLPIGRQWQEARIRRGTVFDPWTGRWRILLVLKDSLFKVWSEQSVASTASESEQAGPITKAKGGAPSASPEIYQALDRLSQQDHRVKTMGLLQLAKIVARECGKQLGEAKWANVTVFRHIRSWRAKH